MTESDMHGGAVAKDGSEALGAQELAGCFVSSKGLTKKVTGATAGGLVGGIAGRVAGGALGGKTETPPFGALGYVSATATEVAIIKGKSGLMKPSVSDNVIARMPRDQIAGVQLDGKMLTAAFTISFADGGEWEFEVPKIHRKNAEAVAALLHSAG